jgi:hypothetical protein
MSKQAWIFKKGLNKPHTMPNAPHTHSMADLIFLQYPKVDGIENDHGNPTVMSLYYSPFSKITMLKELCGLENDSFFQGGQTQIEA